MLARYYGRGTTQGVKGTVGSLARHNNMCMNRGEGDRIDVVAWEYRGVGEVDKACEGCCTLVLDVQVSSHHGFRPSWIQSIGSANPSERFVLVEGSCVSV